MNSKHIILGRNRQEIIQPAMINFPLKFIHQEFSSYTYQLIDWHWHDAIQYCYISSGTISFQIGKHHLQLSEGDGLFINSQQVHTAVPKVPTSSYFCLNIPRTLLGSENSSLFQQFSYPLLFNTNFSFVPFYKTISMSGFILSRLETCCALAQSNHFNLELLSELVLLWQDTLTFLPKNTTPPHSHTATNIRLQKILTYLHKNYDQNITLEQIANEIHLSRNECSRFFHNLTGQQLFAYLNALRISKSINLLLKTDKNISEIAYTTGFCNQSYYSQRFRAKEGMSPVAFRKKFKNKT